MILANRGYPKLICNLTCLAQTSMTNPLNHQLGN